MRQEDGLRQKPGGARYLPDRAIGRALRAAAARAHAPYSRFPVGAVLRDARGVLYCGANMENAAYPLGICAERVALLAWRQEGGAPIEAVFIYTDTDGPTPPCGLCRDALAAWAPGARVHLVFHGGASAGLSVSELLPPACPERSRR
jgi:cytidine deaminase